MKNLLWVNSSRKDLLLFPEKVKQEIGYALYIAQKGDKHKSAKPLKGCGSGVFEIISNYDKNTYRGVYIATIGEHIYVLHAFQKKSKRGIKTPKEEINLIKQRIKQLHDQIHY